MFNLDQLLHPVSAVSPCGADITFSQELDAIARARQHDDPGLDQGEWVTALKEADWPFVATRCEQLIASHSKDLRVAVWLAEAHAKTRHFRGLGDGYALLAGLCDRYWDGLFPPADEGDHEQRIGNLYWLLSRTPQLVREMPLTAGADGQFALQDFDMARQRAAASQAQDGTEQGWSASRHDEAVPLAQMEAARQKNTRAFSDALLADAQYCMQSLLALERSADARFGTDGPSFRAARDALENAIHFIAPLAPEADLAGTPAATGPAGGSGGGTSMPNPSATAPANPLSIFASNASVRRRIAGVCTRVSSKRKAPMMWRCSVTLWLIQNRRACE